MCSQQQGINKKPSRSALRPSLMHATGAAMENKHRKPEKRALLGKAPLMKTLKAFRTLRPGFGAPRQQPACQQPVGPYACTCGVLEEP